MQLEDDYMELTDSQLVQMHHAIEMKGKMQALDQAKRKNQLIKEKLKTII